MLYNIFNKLWDMFLDINYLEIKDSFNPDAANKLKNKTPSIILQDLLVIYPNL